jgi:uncharacterized protein (TIGR00297 family)
VAANGGVAGILVICSALSPYYDLYLIYLGAVAAVTADTWGTEIGLLSKGNTVSLLTWRTIEKGRSGGVSEAGVIGGIVGGGVIAASGYAWFADLRGAMAVVAAGAIGSLVDSLLGAALQVQYRCGVCGKITERMNHCGRPAERIRGLTWMNNDVVNAICSLTGAVAAWGLTIL